MAGWNCFDRETIEWDGTIRILNNLIINRKIGVGTSTPANPIDVVGIVRSRTDAGGTSGFYATQATPVNTLIMDNNASGSARIVTNAAVPIVLGSNLSTNQLVIASNAFVGIGITTPTNILSIKVADVTTLNAQNPIITGQSTSFTNQGAIYITVDAVSPYGYGMLFKTYKESVGLIDTIKISSTGKIGIATTTPSRMLEVSGAILVSGASGAMMFNNTPTFTFSNTSASGALFMSGAILYFSSGAQAYKVALA